MTVILTGLGEVLACFRLSFLTLPNAHHMLKTTQPYRELGADYLDRLNADYLKRSLLKRLERLEVQVTVHNVVHPVTLPA
jgi:hypothetical protein